MDIKDAPTPKAPRYWVLAFGGYPDTQADYESFDAKEDIFAMIERDRMWFTEPHASVYVGSREPWTECDPYPDLVAYLGARGGHVWERA